MINIMYFFKILIFFNVYVKGYLLVKLYNIIICCTTTLNWYIFGEIYLSYKSMTKVFEFNKVLYVCKEKNRDGLVWFWYKNYLNSIRDPSQILPKFLSRFNPVFPLSFKSIFQFNTKYPYPSQFHPRSIRDDTS